MPRMKLSDEQIQRLNDTGFKWSLPKNGDPRSVSDKRFNDLMAFKAKYGHCDVSQTGGFIYLGQWCSERRVSRKSKTIRCQKYNYLMNRFNA